ncbi:MAG TPA: tetratricopeptide repeat protein [Terriglobia bacterium]|nr:tetratricopeptide repeat protein [Terriglobia bacterium]
MGRALVLLVLVAAPSLVNASSLPPLPEVTTIDLFPSVVKQVEEAYQTARSHPMDAAANGKLAMVLDTYEQFSLAEVCYQRAHLLDPKSFEWAYDLGYVLFKEGRYTQAVDALREALALRPDYVPAKLKLADSLFSARQTEAAGKVYQEIVQVDPGSADAWYGLGRVQAAQGDPKAAAVSLGKACELVPRYGAAQFALATAYRKLGEQEKATEHFKLYQANMTNVPPAVDPVRAAVQVLNQGATMYLRRGLDLAQAGDLQGAIQQHLEAIQADPNEVQSYINLIQLYARIGEKDKAVEAYQKAVAINPNRADCYYNYGVLMFDLRKLPDAEQAMRKAIQINPFYAEAHDSLGYLLAIQGHLDEALDQYRKAVEERPDFRLARFHIGQVLVNQGNLPEAIEEFQKILTPDDANTPGYLYALGATYARAGDRQNALAYMRKARDKAAARNQEQLLTSIDRDISNLEK